MNSLIPLLALGFDFGESVPYLLGGGAGAGALAFLPKILEKLGGKKKPDDGTKPDISSILDIIKGGDDKKPDISAILELLKKLGGDKTDPPKPDNGGGTIADILQIGGLKANADALKKLMDSMSAQGFPTKLVIDAEFAKGDPIHLEFNRAKKPAKDGAAA